MTEVTNMEVVENIQVPLQEEAQSGSVRNVLLEIVEDQPKWLKETIEAKKNLIISIMLSKDRHLSDEKKISLMDLRNIGLEQDINDCHNNAANTSREEEIILTTLKQIADFNSQLIERVQIMETVVKTQMTQRLENSHKMSAHLSRKTKQLLASKGDVLTAHETLMSAKVEDFKSVDSDVKRISEATEEIRQKINSVFIETDNEIQRFDEVDEKLREIDCTRQQFESSECLLARLDSEIEAKIEATNELNLMIETVDNQINSLEKTYDLLQQDQHSATDHFNSLEILLKEMFHLMGLVQSKVTLSQMEFDEVFRREVSSLDYFKQLKSFVEEKQLDNMNINNDVANKNEEIESQGQLLDELHKKLETLNDELRGFESNVGDTSIDQLEVQQNENHKAIEALEKEIAELNADATKCQDELEGMKKGHEVDIAKMNTKLKTEQEKTKRAKEQQKQEQKALFSKIANQQKHFDAQRSNLSQENPITLKRRHQEVASSSQPLIISTATSNMAQQNLDSEIPALPKKIKVSDEKLSQKFSLPLKRVNSDQVAKTILSDSNQLNLIEKLPTSKSPNEPTVEVFDPITKFHQLLKENLPKSFNLNALTKPISLKNAALSKPFDSDEESSFNITFDTDVEDLLE